MNLLKILKAVEADFLGRMYGAGTHPEKKLVHEKDGGTHMQTFHVSNEKKEEKKEVKPEPQLNKLWTEEQIDAADAAYAERLKEYQSEMNQKKMHGGQHELFSHTITGGGRKNEQLSLIKEIPKEAIAEPLTMKQLDKLVSAAGVDKNVSSYLVDIGKRQGAPSMIAKRIGIAFLEYKITGDLDKYEKVRKDFGLESDKTVKKPEKDKFNVELFKALLANKKNAIMLLKALRSMRA